MKHKTIIPVFCFNEHNEAYYYWHRARTHGHFTKALDLVHVDAHEDMGLPPVFSESIYPQKQSDASRLKFYHRFASNQLTISDFILPAILSGVIRNVYFVYPKWRKFKPIRKKHTICSAFGEGKVLKTRVKPKKSDHPLVNKAYPDLTPFYYITGRVEQLPKNRKVILDIDLDYFACRDSITNQMSYELEITQEQFKQKELFLKDKTLPFSGIEINFFQRNGRFFARIERKKTTEKSHFPSEDEIEHEIESLVSVLIEKKIKPSVVTICRSCDSGYCPEEMSRFIEPLLIQKLQLLIT